MREDEFKRHKRHHSRQINTDGFLSSDSFKHRVSNVGFDKLDDNQESDKLVTENLDDFKRQEGFQSSSPAVAGGEKYSTSLPHGPRKKHSFSPGSKHDKPKNRRGLTRIFHKPKSWKQFFKRAALVTGVLILLVGGYLGYKLYMTQRRVLAGGGQAPAVCDGDVPVSELNTEGDGRVNVLLLGIGGPGHDAPNLTDTIILASIDTVTDKADLISIPRDLWVNIPNLGYQKINASFESGIGSDPSAKLDKTKIKGGLKNADQVISKVLGVKIHYNVLLDFKAFKDAVNALGGVDVNVPETLYDPTIAWENNWNPVIAKKGPQHFNGAKALLYARSRETSSDFARGERQRLLLVAIKDKTFSLGTFSNPVKVSSLLDSLGNNVYTDFDVPSIKCLYEQGSQIQSSNIKSVDFVTPPNDLVTTGNIGGISIVKPKAGLYDFSAIQLFVRKTLVDGFIAKENANITVLNGTNIAGLAQKEANLLKSYGYNIKTVGDAPTKNYQQTTLVDITGIDKYTKHYLENRLGVSATGKMPDKSISPDSADFVIIVGANANNNF